MYGFVNSALEKLVQRRFGREKWEEIRQRANLQLGETNTFLINHVYRDDETYVVVGAAAEVLGLEPGTILELFGEQFLVWCKESGYAQTLQRLGRSLQDFLTNLDALHDHLSIIYPQMDAPSFRCTETSSKREFQLHYYSSRDGLERIVIGIVKSVAREFYGVEVEMTLEGSKSTGLDHAIFSIKEIAYYDKSIDTPSPVHVIDSSSERQLISSRSFCKSFPFHIIFDSDMRILQVGASLAWVIPGWNQPDKFLTTFFVLERPRLKLTFKMVQSHINTIFILRLNTFAVSGLVAYTGSVTDPMRLRGQMIQLPESDSMLFLCSPRVSSIQDLEQRSLYLSDIPIHDATRSLLMMSQAAKSEFAHVVQLEELIGQLRTAQKSLEEEKARMRDLLHEMLPITVADSLLAGQMIEAERFDSVTILFSDIVGFTSIAGSCQPMQIVNMLNKLYTLFDQVVGKNRVYKVETIGDAYMVVGGLPEPDPKHAECVAHQALDMMHYCKQVIRPMSNPPEPIQMRIGIHSGDVVAGVVGRRMPRYCLFGNTVNVASRTESNGLPSKIQITEPTYNLLKDNPDFIFSRRGAIEFKNVKEPMMCYFLEDIVDKEYLVIEVDDDGSVQYNLLSSGTPPTTPFLPTIITPLDSPQKKLVSQTSIPPFEPQQQAYISVPNIEVINATPEHSPHPSPPTLPMKCPFSSVGPTQRSNPPMYLSSPPANKKQANFTIGDDDEKVRRISQESYCSSRDTETVSSITESDWSEDGHSTSGVSLVVSPSKLEPVREDELDSPNMVEQVIKRLETEVQQKKTEPNGALRQEVRQERSLSPPSNERERRSLSSISSTQSMTSEDSGEDESTTPSKKGVRYVRPRSTSIKQIKNIFETKSLDQGKEKGRRSGVANYLPSSK